MWHHRYCKPYFPRTINTCVSCSSTTNITVGSATWSCFTSFYPPPPPPKPATTVVGRLEMIKYCKTMILPKSTDEAFQQCEERTPIRVLAAAIFCILEKHQEPMLLITLLLRPHNYIRPSQASIIKVDHMHIKENRKPQTRLLQVQKSKRQSLLHLQYPLHQPRKKKNKKLTNHQKNLKWILHMKQYHQQIRYPQGVRIPSLTSSSNNS